MLGIFNLLTNDLVVWGIIIGIMVHIARKKEKESKQREKREIGFERNEPDSQDIQIRGAYQKRWLFTYNEKNAYQKLKQITDELNLIIFSKVRLLDLLEPISGNPKYKTYLS